MYAAAGGASLASRKARQTKQKKTQQAAEKLAKEKATSGLITPTRIQQSRQFHQLSSNYLRTPGGPSRKLSAASYANNKYLLPIHEGNNGLHSHSHHHHSHHQAAQPGTYQHHLQQQHIHHHQQHHQHLQQQHHHLLKNHDSCGSGGSRSSTPRLVHRHDGEGGVIVHSHLTKSATATLPLVSQANDDYDNGTPPTTPLISINNTTGVGDKLLSPTPGRGSLGSNDITSLKKINNLNALPIPHDSIIVTPATPIASPGHSPKAVVNGTDYDDDNYNDAVATIESKQINSPTTNNEIKDFFGPGPFLERKCSFNRVKRIDTNTNYQHYDDYNEDDNQSVLIPPSHELTTAQLHHYRDYTDDSNLIPNSSLLPNGVSGGGGHKWAQCAYCEEGICICEHIECAQGKAAWLERGRRCSVQDNNTASCQKKWIQDSSLAGSSDDEDLLGVLRGPSSFANAFLYVGLGTVAIGLVIAFVGTGEKGFKTVELRLIGPSLIGIGLICCILRICFCICPSHCISTSRRARKKNSNKVDADHTTSLLRGESKRVSIAKGPQKFPLMRKKSNNKMLNEGMEALRQIATTSLFLQNEQKPSTTSNRVVPIIKEPEKQSDSPLEMKKLDTTLNISDITDDEDEDDSDLATGGRRTVTIAATTSNYHDNNNLTNINNNNSSNVLQNQNAESLQRTPSKLGRQRVSINQQSLQQKQESPQQQQQQTILDNDTLLMETSLMIINPTPPPSSATRITTTTSDITATTTNTNSFSNFSNNNNNNSNNKSTILAPPPLSQLPLQQQSLLTPSIATTTTITSSYKTPLNSLIQSNYQATPATPPTTTLLAPRSSYDLPPTLPHQQLMQQQHTPGQILDNTSSSKHNFGSSSTSTNSGYFGSKINNSKSGNNEISPLLLTPSLLPGSTGPYANNYLNSTASTSSASAKVGFNLNPSSSNLTTSSQTTEPSELVLSPSKLGQ